MWRLKPFGIAFLLTSLVLFGAGLWVRAEIPRVGEKIRSGFNGQARTSVHQAFLINQPFDLYGTRVTVTEADLDRAMWHADEADTSFNGFTVDLQPGRVALVGRNGGDGVGLPFFTATPDIENGRIVLRNRTTPFTFIFSADEFADAIEAEVADVFETSGVAPTGVTVTNDRILIELDPATTPPADLTTL